MTIFWERAAHSNSLLCLFVVLVVSNLGFNDGNSFMIATAPDHFFLLLFRYRNQHVWIYIHMFLTALFHPKNMIRRDELDFDIDTVYFPFQIMTCTVSSLFECTYRGTYHNLLGLLEYIVM